MNQWTSLIAGGVAGTVSRYLLAGWILNLLGPGFPYGILIVNLAGCFLIGLFTMVLEVKMLAGPETRLLLMTGFCGAFTTFSTLILETHQLIAAGQGMRALVYVLASFFLGFAFFRFGIWAGSFF